ncbi:hypothetical protein [uncultured Thiodictyon sp.]|uniref:hypothetical protein n=1 Tax=uncultured Thiodictyon sp. TaxID=1846217 RepID=UPI0025EE11CE|nr:hypothetical protein [uncultured Thiodictyon sp.]
MPADPIALLLAADGQPAAGGGLPLGPDGLGLLLGVASGQELDTGAALLVAPELGDLTLSPAVVTESGGLDPATAVAWISADWGEERPLTAVTLTLAPGIAPDDARRARLKVQSRGAWLPLYPNDLVPIGAEQRLAPVGAQALMAELVRPAVYDGKTLPGVWQPDPVQLRSLEVKAGWQPRDLRVAVGDGAPFFERSGLLPGAGVRTTGLADAVNAWLARSPGARAVPIRLTAAAGGQVRVTLEGRVRHLVCDLAGSPDQGLTLPWAAPGVAPIPLAPGAELLEAVCQPVAQLKPQRIRLAPDAADRTGRAQRCTPQMAVAQGFAALPEDAALTGLDLRVLPRGAAGSGTLALHPDLHGRPAPAPFGGGVLPLAWDGLEPGASDSLWIGAEFPDPLALPEPRWWLVLTLAAGELLWSLGDVAPPGAGGVLYLNRDGTWLPPTGSKPGTWALTRLRTAASPGAVTGVRLRRGGVTVPWAADPVDGRRLKAAPADLARLNDASDATMLEVLADGQSAGRVRLADLRVRWR